MSGAGARFWIAVGLVSVLSVALTKVLLSQKLMPDGAKHLAGFL